MNTETLQNNVNKIQKTVDTVEIDNTNKLEETSNKYKKSFNIQIVKFIQELNLSFPEFKINIELTKDENIIEIFYTI